MLNRSVAQRSNPRTDGCHGCLQSDPPLSMPIVPQHTGQTAEASCTACTAKSDSPAQSSARACCTCNAGYGGDASTGTCTACVAGKFKTLAGHRNCTDCGSGSYGTATGPTTESSCTACGEGKYGVGAGQTAEASCTACSAGKYRVGTVGSAEASCTTCTPNSKSPPQSNAQADCWCDVGYTGPDGGTCTACVAGKNKISTGSANRTDCGAGTYSTAVTAISTCITCPTNSNSPGGSSALTSCTCNAGSWGQMEVYVLRALQERTRHPQDQPCVVTVEPAHTQ